MHKNATTYIEQILEGIIPRSIRCTATYLPTSIKTIWIWKQDMLDKAEESNMMS